MTAPARARAWVRVATAYFAAAVALGLWMGVSGDHRLLTVHAHLNLLGWVSMALFGLLGVAFPSLVQGRLAGAQFWLHQLGTPVMLVALSLRLTGHEAAEPWVGAGSVMVVAAVALFAWQVLRRLEAPAAAERPR